MEDASRQLRADLRASYGALSLWEREYAEPWMLLLNTLAVVGYQIISMSMVAYQVLFRRNYIMICWHEKLPAWQLWSCELTKAFTRFFPLVAILISMSLVRSIVLIQRMYYELLRRGALLHFKEYKVTNEPIFYVLTVCFVLGCSNWLLEMLVPTPEGVILYHVPELQGTRQWFVYLVVPIVAFILSLYFTHEPSYTLVPLSRYLGDADVEAAQARVAKLVHVKEENLRAISVRMQVKPCHTPEETEKVFQELIDMVRDFEESGSVMVNQQCLTTTFSRNQITDRFWPSVFLLSPELQDEDSCRFRLVSRCCDLSCVLLAGLCVSLFIASAVEDYQDVRNGETEDLAAIVVEAAHVAFGLFYIRQICRSLL